MTQTSQIRRRPDGSIDTAHYMAAGRTRRSEAAHAMLPENGAARRGVPVLTALVALVFGARLG